MHKTVTRDRDPGAETGEAQGVGQFPPQLSPFTVTLPVLCRHVHKHSQIMYLLSTHLHNKCTAMQSGERDWNAFWENPESTPETALESSITLPHSSEEESG